MQGYLKFLHYFIRVLSGAAIITLCSSCEEVASYAYNLRAGAFCWQATASGYWKGNDVPGSPKIVVNLGEQRAYFYKGKRVIGESTVSTGKPGFSTPPGHYRIISKDRTTSQASSAIISMIRGKS
jgi:L,D-transpeptidase catalytic domain